MYEFGPTFYFDRLTGGLLYLRGTSITTEADMKNSFYEYVPMLASRGKENILEVAYPTNRKDMNNVFTANLNIETGDIVYKLYDWKALGMTKQQAEKVFPDYPFENSAGIIKDTIDINY